MGTSKIGYNPTCPVQELPPLNIGLIGLKYSSEGFQQITLAIYRNSQGNLGKTNLVTRPIFLE